MLLLRAVRLDPVDPVVFVLLEVDPVNPNVVLAPGVLVDVEVHVENIMS